MIIRKLNRVHRLNKNKVMGLITGPSSLGNYPDSKVHVTRVQDCIFVFNKIEYLVQVL